MTWHYRILRHDDGTLALHEVYCNDEGKPDRYTAQPIRFVVDGEEGPAALIEALTMALKDATERPILDVASFGPNARRFIPAQEAFEEWRKDPAHRAAYDALEDEFAAFEAEIEKGMNASDDPLAPANKKRPAPKD